VGTLLIKNVAVVEPDAVLPSHAVVCREGKIEWVGPETDLAPAPAGAVLDGGGAYLAPGYIDLHIHGTHEFLVDTGPDHVEGLCGVLPTYGLTGFLPTVCPRPKGEDARALASLAGVRPGGTQVLGFHLEGPFLTLTGALPPEALGTADPERVRALMDAAGPYAAVFSVSPDFEGILELIPIMREGGAPVFMTHTEADVQQTRAALEAGARHATHFYDVFPISPVSDPGVRPCGAVEAVLADARASVDFILDGEHVDPVAVKMALACKGPDRVCLITDANVGAGLPPARYQFTEADEVEFAYAGGPARGTENSRFPGGLAGSGLTLDRAVRNAVQMLGVSIPQAIRMGSTNPAKVLGLDRVKGVIKKGYDADMIMLDESLHVLRTWVKGECVFHKGAAQ